MLTTNTLKPNDTITIFYPITIYDNNIDKLILHIDLDTSKSIDIELTK